MAEQSWDAQYTAQDTLKALGPDGQLMDFANTLDERLPILADAQFYPANDAMSHRDLREVSLPTPQVVALGDGWASSKNEFSPYTEGMGIYKDRIQVAKDITKISPNPGRERSKREARHMEGFNQGVSNDLLNSTNVTDPEKIRGLTLRYPTLATNGVYNVGGSGSALTSAWMIQWGEDLTHLIYPKNHPHIGVNIEDMGLQFVTTETPTGGSATGSIKKRWDYVTELEWWLGWNIKDQRSTKRVCNIPTNLYSGGLTDTLIKKIIEARNAYRTSGTVFVYVSETTYNALDFLAMDKNNVRYSNDNPWGREIMMIRDMPIRKWDSITDTETALA